jgi:hypothetical protein
VGGPDTLVVLGNDPYGDPVRSRVAGRVTAEHGMRDEEWAVFTAGAGWVVVEQDVLPGMDEPRESALRNGAYLRALGI